jgi:hypothetical protein
MVLGFDQIEMKLWKFWHYFSISCQLGKEVVLGVDNADTEWENVDMLFM